MRSKFKNYTFEVQKGKIHKIIKCKDKKDFDKKFNYYLDEGYFCIIDDKR